VKTLSPSITRLGWIALLVGVSIASCSPFEANSADGADSGAADAAAAAVGASDQSAADGGGAADSADADADAPVDGSVLADAATFCSTFISPIRCFDFDESNPPTGLTFDLSGGTRLFDTTFATGSPPNALFLTSTVASGKNTATMNAIDLVPLANKTVTVAFRFSVMAAPPSTEFIARLNFSSGPSASITADPGGLHCASSSATPLVGGSHSVILTIPINGVGAVTMLSCVFDMNTPVTSSVGPSQALGVELGNVSSASGSFTVAYDNVVVHTN